MVKQLAAFHTIVDRDIRAYQTSGGIRWWPGPIPFTLRERSLTYQFFPHYHPYVPALIQRLNEGGITELLAADTAYLPQTPSGQPPQPLDVLPGSTRATLAATTTATRPDGSAVALSAGTPLTLPDGTSLTVPAGTEVAAPDGSTSLLAAAATVTLPGNLPVASSSGIQFTIAGEPAIVPDYTPVTLPGGANSAVLTNDGSNVALPSGTGIAIRSGLPEPLYYASIFDPSHYEPDATSVQHPYPLNDLDFTFDGAYAIYNWELFFHAPLLIAVHLSQNQKFQDAQAWFHYIFNPTDNSPGPTPERFWKVLPFQSTDVKMIEQILLNLSTNQDPELYQQTVSSIYDWKDNPFQPFEVAKYRPTAYMLKTVMAYLDNLIAWGDSLFQQYTIETINEATQMYVMAANILGPKPQAVPNKGSVKALTYNDLRRQQLDPFGNALVDMEVDIPFDIAPLPGPVGNPAGTQILAGIGKTLYFCTPRNDKLLAYWDTVADRLFKIHNSLNLQGVFQQLPLYDPPIDPALLVRAAAAGLDVNAIVSGLNQPLPLVHFQFLVSKAVEIGEEVKTLGSGLLAAIEKQDNESLALMRAQHENIVFGLAEIVKYAQWQDAAKARQALEVTLSNAANRYVYYQQLLGQSTSQALSQIPALDALDIGSLQSLNFSQSDENAEPQQGTTAITVNIAQDATQVSDGAMVTLTNRETGELKNLSDADSDRGTAGTYQKLANVMSFIPMFGGRVSPFGVGMTMDFGGSNLASAMSFLGDFYRSDSESETYQASRVSKLGSYDRRQTEWIYQGNLAVGEINLTLKQLRGAQIREAIAQREYQNHQTQMQQAQTVVDFLQGNDTHSGFQVKESTIGFYAWMKREVKGLYAKSFQLAFETAKKAERALQHELGDPTLSYIQYSYLDGIEGLLAGEKLLFDLKTMEMAYHDLNQREYELTKHVSLLQVAPLALVQLRATGNCTFTIPEEAFDMDGPSHFFRRIKDVAVTIPCVVGPYTGVNCTLSLQSSSIRISPDVADGYTRKGPDDSRFDDYYGSLQSIVTSSGQSDSGLFERDASDVRYVPFDRAGVVNSQWQMSLPADVRQFDFDTITDIIIHIRYTAREGGEILEAAAVNNLHHQINAAQTVGSVRLFSVRHEFPGEWAKFRSATIGTATPTAALSLALRPEHYPFWARGLVGAGPVKAVELFAEMADSAVTVNIYDKPDKSGNSDAMSQNPAFGGLLAGNLVKITRPSAVTDATHPPLALYFDDNVMTDLWLAVTWGKA